MLTIMTLNTFDPNETILVLYHHLSSVKSNLLVWFSLNYFNDNLRKLCNWQECTICSLSKHNDKMRKRSSPVNVLCCSGNARFRHFRSYYSCYLVIPFFKKKINKNQLFSRITMFFIIILIRWFSIYWQFVSPLRRTCMNAVLLLCHTHGCFMWFYFKLW